MSYHGNLWIRKHGLDKASAHSVLWRGGCWVSVPACDRYTGLCQYKSGKTRITTESCEVEMALDMSANRMISRISSLNTISGDIREALVGYDRQTIILYPDSFLLSFLSSTHTKKESFTNSK